MKVSDKMISGIGLDLLDIDRIKKNIENDRFMERVFSEYEREYIRARGRMAPSSAAGIFCAKEAFIKAVGHAVSLCDIRISHNESGKPLLSLAGKSADEYKNLLIHLSITHTETTASAFVVCERLE